MYQNNENNKAPGEKPARGIKIFPLLLIGLVLLIITAGLYFLTQREVDNRGNLSAKLASLQKLVAASSSRQDTIKVEIVQAQKDLETAEASYPRLEKAPEILEKFIEMLQDNDIEVASTQIRTAKRDLKEGEAKFSYSLLEVQLGVRGQISKFQNFLLDIDKAFPTSELSKVHFDIAKDETEQDRASMTITIYCREENK